MNLGKQEVVWMCKDTTRSYNPKAGIAWEVWGSCCNHPVCGLPKPSVPGVLRILPLSLLLKLVAWKLSLMECKLESPGNKFWEMCFSDFHTNLWNTHTHKRIEASRAHSWLLNRKYICAYVQACVTDSITACVSILALASRKFRNFPPLFLNLVFYILWILIKPTVVWRVDTFVVFNFFYI